MKNRGYSWAYGSYGDADNPHRRSEKIGDVDLEIFRLNADLDYHNVIMLKLALSSKRWITSTAVPW